ncbi:MAG: DUF4279 domain-containing protein [Bacteroidota bacterium]
MKAENTYIEVASAEILDPRFETTKQLLEVCQVALENGRPKVARFNETYSEDKAIVYFEVKDENYFIEVHVSKGPTVEVHSVWTESGHRVYLTATSKELSFTQLSDQLINFNPLTGWSKGDLRKNNASKHTFSRVSFEPIKNQAYGLNEKLDLLLTELERDIEGVRELSKKTKAIIAVCRRQYVSGNAGIHLDSKTVDRLHQLGLGIDIDTYIEGQEIR